MSYVETFEREGMSTLHGGGVEDYPSEQGWSTNPLASEVNRPASTGCNTVKLVIGDMAEKAQDAVSNDKKSIIPQQNESPDELVSYALHV